MMKNKWLLILVLLSSCFHYAKAQQANQYQLSTHILDISKGEPAQGIVVSLYKYDTQTLDWIFVDKAVSLQTGRTSGFLPADQDNFGAYKLRFETEGYFQSQSLESIYPYIEIPFYVKDGEHYHIPVLISANGYSTYRGS